MLWLENPYTWFLIDFGRAKYTGDMAFAESALHQTCGGFAECFREERLEPRAMANG